MECSSLKIRESECVHMNRSMRVAGVLLALCLMCLPVRAQLNTGRISGAITDQTGGTIGGATVTVTEVARGESRTLTADSAGLYAAPNLNPGIYTVRAEFKGFQTVERQNVQVDVGGDIRVDITLQPGAQTQTVTVTEALPVINTTNAQTGGTLDNNFMANIPLNGRNFHYMEVFIPGVNMNAGEGCTNSSVYGSGPYNLNWMIDGLYEQGVYLPEGGAGGASEAGDTTILPLDAIQEVNMVINPRAEYGWNPGLTESVGLKSGTNTIHGSAYAYGRDEALDAKNAFAAQRGPVAFEQFGASVGGPIKKNKLFYFMAFEGVRVDVTNTFGVTSPTDAHFTGTSGGCPATPAGDPAFGPGNCSSSIPDAIAAINYLNMYAPPAGTAVRNALSLNIAGCDPTNPNISSVNPVTVALACTANQYGAPSLFNNASATTTAVTNNFQNQGGSNQGLAKLDYHINDHHTFNASYYFGRYLEKAVSSTTNSGGAAITQPYWEEWLGVQTTMVRAVEIWTPNSNWLNEARLGMDHNHRPVSGAECTGANTTAILGGTTPLGYGAPLGGDGGPIYPTQYGLVSGAPACGMPTTTINTFSDQLGFANNRMDDESIGQGADSLSYTHGTHQFKFGTDVRSEIFLGAKTTNAQQGVVAFGATNIAAFTGASPLESFLAGVASSESIEPGIPVRNLAWNMIGVFAQDDWRVLPRLTLNLGLRWEGETPIGEEHGLLGNFAPNTPSGMIQQNLVWKFQSGFEPRLGLVWDLTGQGKTVLRAGGVVMYHTAIASTAANSFLEPTGATLYLANGSTMQGPGTINDPKIAKAPITAGGIATGNLIPWAANAPLFANITPVCGNGLVPVAPVVGAPAINPSTCNGYAINTNFKFLQNFSWNLDIQHAFTNNLSLTVGYIGSHQSDVGGNLDLNQPTPGASGGSNEQARKPYNAEFPWFSTITDFTTFGSTNFAGLEASLTERASHGFTFTASYTLSHALGISQNGFGGQAVENSLDPRADYGTMAQDARHHFTLTATYAVPTIKAPAQLGQGWALNASANLTSALPFLAYDTSFDTSGTGEKEDRWTLYGPASAFNKIAGPGAGTTSAVLRAGEQ